MQALLRLASVVEPKKDKKATSITDEIKELKKMLDEGTLNKEQFEKAKNQLLEKSN